MDELQWTWDDTPESVAYAKPHKLYFTNKLKDFQGSYDWSVFTLDFEILTPG